MKAFEVDFNHPKWFTAVDVTDDLMDDFLSKDELPEVGEKVIVVCMETKTLNREWMMTYDAGFGFVAVVTDVRPAQTDNCFIIEFERDQ